MRRLLIGVCAIGALIVPLGGSAIARPPIGGCPTSRWLLAAAPEEPSPGDRSTDLNGDELSCYLEVPEGGGVFTIIDNVSHPR